MPELKIKFDRHGLGDCVHQCHAVQLYKRRGYDVTVQAEENKLFVWKVAEVNIVQSAGLPDHSYHYPAHFEDLSRPDWSENKVAFGLRNNVVPSLDSLGLTAEQAWDELCAVRLDALPFVSPEAFAEAEKFLEGIPRPIICFHSRGTNWHERKSIPTETAFEMILALLKRTEGSVIVLDFDARAPMVGHARCKGIVPSWGTIDPERQCALLSKADLMIGIDSGPFHLAAMTPVKCLGVFRDLHPNRVCLPNPNAVYLASDRHAGFWESRRDRWNIQTYSGGEASAENIADAAIAILEGKTITMTSPTEISPIMEELAGRYVYHRVGHDSRELELLPKGIIGSGSGDCEKSWTATTVHGVKQISISGVHGTICDLMEGEGRFTGKWLKFERMPIELTPVVPHEVPTDPISESDVPGTYEWQRGDSDKRILVLLPDGTIPDDAGDEFKKWKVLSAPKGSSLSIFGACGGPTCHLASSGGRLTGVSLDATPRRVEMVKRVSVGHPSDALPDFETTFYVGVPTLFRHDLLHKCIESILSGTALPRAIFVVDNSDGTRMEAWKPHPSKRVRVIRPTTNLGVAASWNLLHSACPNEPLIISNDDVEIGKNTFEQMVKCPEPFVTADGRQAFCVFLLRAELRKKIGPFDETFFPAYHEDNDFGYRMSLAGAVDVCPPSDGIRDNGPSATKAMFNEHELNAFNSQFDKCRAYYVRKWGGTPHLETFKTAFNGETP